MEKLEKTEEVRERSSLSEGFWILGVLALGLLPRVLVLKETNFGIESDEAIVGLMAKHILEGSSRPIFYYGQDYLGSFEAYVAAGYFSYLGVSSLALKLVPLTFSLIFILLTYLLTLRFTGIYGARVASLMVALSPSALMLWGLKARGGFIELLVVGSLCLLQTARISSKAKVEFQDTVALGLLLGFGWWVNNQIIFYLVSIGCWLFVWQWLKRGVLSSIYHSTVTAGAFFIGGAPFWYANFAYEPRFSSLRTLFGGTLSSARGETERSLGSATFDHLGGFFETSLPILFGARRFWTETDLYFGSSLITYAIYGLCFLIVLFLAFSKKQKTPLLSLLAIFPPIVALIFSVSSFGWLSQAPRYLLPLYSVLPIIIAVAVSYLRVSLRQRMLSNAIVVLLLAVNLASNYWGSIALPGQPVVYGGERVAESHQELYSWLAKRNYRHIYANYWIGYRVAFETKEAVRFARYRGPQSLRIEHYEHASLEKLQEAPVYVLVPSEATLTARGLSEIGYRFRKTRVGSYDVIDMLEPVSDIGRRVEIKSATATHASDKANFATDGEISTRWSSSGTPQKDGMSFEVGFRATKVSGLSFNLGFWPHDFPREIQVLGLTPDNIWCELFDSRGLDIRVDFGQKWQFYFEPQNFIALKLVQRGEHDIFDWSIAELQVFGPARR